MITASCGCRVEDDDELLDVEWEGEDCDPLEGIVPCTFYARYCRACAVKYGHIDPEPEK